MSCNMFSSSYVRVDLQSARNVVGNRENASQRWADKYWNMSLHCSACHSSFNFLNFLNYFETR